MASSHSRHAHNHHISIRIAADLLKFFFKIIFLRSAVMLLTNLLCVLYVSSRQQAEAD